MPPRKETQPINPWGLPRLCNFLLQADSSSAKEIAEFYAALKEPAQLPPALTASALALQCLGEHQKDEAALVIATKLCQHMKAMLADKGGPFGRVQAAFMAVVATALQR